jgi:hypothetical protein
VKKLIGIGALLLVSACQPKATVGSPTPTPGATSGPGAATPTEALATFMTAAKAEDLQGVSAIWGDHEGLVRDKVTRQELEMRTYIMVKCLRHDRYTVLSDGTGTGGRRRLNVQLNKGGLTRTSNFTLTPGPSGRWLVENFEIEPLNSICQLP